MQVQVIVCQTLDGEVSTYVCKNNHVANLWYVDQTLESAREYLNGTSTTRMILSMVSCSNWSRTSRTGTMTVFRRWLGMLGLCLTLSRNQIIDDCCPERG